MVENHAKPIWEAIHTTYGAGFFNEIIEEEFGIKPGQT